MARIKTSVQEGRLGIKRGRRYYAVSLGQILNELDTHTHDMDAQELGQLLRSGVLPCGVYAWLLALRKADVAIPSKNPRPM
jgi:hypothetical protein